MDALQTLFFGYAHARPSGTNADAEVRGARGAWFEALALADDQEAFHERVRIELEDIDFELIEIDDVRPFSLMLEDTQLAPSLLELANAAAYENRARFGPFHLYERDDESEEADEEVTRDDVDPRELLRHSLEHAAPIRLRRSPAALEALEGFVVGVGAQWVILQEIDGGIDLNGYAAFPDVDAFDVSLLDEDRATFVLSALTLRKSVPQTLERCPLGSAEELLRWAGPEHALISVYVERDVPDVCFIGRVESFGEDDFTLTLITPGARWQDSESFRYDAVTRIDFGGRYEQALALVAAARRG